MTPLLAVQSLTLTSGFNQSLDNVTLKCGLQSGFCAVSLLDCVSRVAVLGATPLPSWGELCLRCMADAAMLCLCLQSD